MDTLAAFWRQGFADLGAAAAPDTVFAQLQTRYREPHRAYHTLQHLEECFAGLAQVRGQLRAPSAVALALFYHDAIYDTHASDSEERSAALAEDVLRTHAPQVDRAAVTALILATKHDAVPEDGDAQVLVDIDLSILGATPARFDEYERQVRFEYQWVEAEAFRAGRSKVLRHFLERPAIYSTPYFGERLDTRARENLARSLKALSG